MTIKELKEKVQHLPDDMRVYCSGFDESPEMEPAVLMLVDVVKYPFPEGEESDCVMQPIIAAGESWYKGEAPHKALLIDFQGQYEMPDNGVQIL